LVEPDTPQERAAVIAWWLARGRRLTTGEVAAIAGVSERRAQQLLNELSRVLPIVRLDDEGHWVSMAEL